MTDQKVLAKVSAIPGVTVKSHVGSLNFHVLVKVADDDELPKLCRLAMNANAELSVFEWGEKDFRYVLRINERAREIIAFEG